MNDLPTLMHLSTSPEAAGTGIVPRPAVVPGAAQVAPARGAIEVTWARHLDEVREAQRLRWLCFVGARRGESDPESLDADDYDQRCRHVLIRETASGRLVACFRMLTLSGGAEIGESYSARFYNLSRLAGYGGRMAEIGRFCIHPEWGDPDILRLAWAALARHVDDEGIEMLFGCSSFLGTDFRSYEDAFAMLRERHLAPRRWLPRVRMDAEAFGSFAEGFARFMGTASFLFWMTVSSFGIAVTTFAGQNFGARQYDRVRRGTMTCLAMTAGTTLCISLALYPLAQLLFRLFSSDDAVVAQGVQMMHYLVPVYMTYICIEIFSGALRGCGDVRVPTIITVFAVCIMRIVWLAVALPFKHELSVVEFSYPLTWITATVLFAIYYTKGGWMQRCIAAQNAKTQG